MDDLNRAESLSQGWADAELAFALVDAALSRCLAALVQTGCWGRDNMPLSGELWRISGHLLSRGSLQLRAREKPLGYAGDYELLAQVIDGHATSDPLGRVFDRYFMCQAAVEAVRSRTQLLARAVAARLMACGEGGPRPFHVVGVGSGPAADIEQSVGLLGSSRSRLRVTLIDLDERALQHAAARLAPLLEPGQLELRRDNLFRLARREPAQSGLASADMILCAGLFDYLADDAAAGLLRCFHASLAPGGTLLVGNFAPHCPTRAYMEWIGNWHLVYRTAGDLARLAGEAGIPRHQTTITTERLGIDLFILAEKPPA